MRTGFPRDMRCCANGEKVPTFHWFCQVSDNLIFSVISIIAQQPVWEKYRFIDASVCGPSASHEASSRALPSRSSQGRDGGLCVGGAPIDPLRGDPFPPPAHSSRLECRAGRGRGMDRETIQTQIAQRQPGARLFVGNIERTTVSKRKLREIFERYGEITEEILLFHTYGFIQFATAAMCEEAVQKEQGRVVGGRAMGATAPLTALSTTAAVLTPVGSVSYFRPLGRARLGPAGAARPTAPRGRTAAAAARPEPPSRKREPGIPRAARPVTVPWPEAAVGSRRGPASESASDEAAARPVPGPAAAARSGPRPGPLRRCGHRRGHRGVRPLPAGAVPCVTRHAARRAAPLTSPLPPPQAPAASKPLAASSAARWTWRCSSSPRSGAATSASSTAATSRPACAACAFWRRFQARPGSTVRRVRRGARAAPRPSHVALVASRHHAHAVAGRAADAGADRDGAGGCDAAGGAAPVPRSAGAAVAVPGSEGAQRPGARSRPRVQGSSAAPGTDAAAARALGAAAARAPWRGRDWLRRRPGRGTRRRAGQSAAPSHRRRRRGDAGHGGRGVRRLAGGGPRPAGGRCVRPPAAAGAAGRARVSARAAAAWPAAASSRRAASGTAGRTATTAAPAAAFTTAPAATSGVSRVGRSCGRGGHGTGRGAAPRDGRPSPAEARKGVVGEQGVGQAQG